MKDDMEVFAKTLKIYPWFLTGFLLFFFNNYFSRLELRYTHQSKLSCVLCSTSLQIRASKGFVFATDARAVSPGCLTHFFIVIYKCTKIQHWGIHGTNFVSNAGQRGQFQLYIEGTTVCQWQVHWRFVQFSIVLNASVILFIFHCWSCLTRTDAFGWIFEAVCPRQTRSCAWGNTLGSSQPTVRRKRSSQQALDFLLLGVWEPLR